MTPRRRGVSWRGAYRITAGQFSDVAAQEMHAEPRADLDLTQVWRHRRHAYGPGRYETVHLVEVVDGVPVLTLSATDPEGVAPNAPSTSYLMTMIHGLTEAHGLDPAACASYLRAADGIGSWTHDQLCDLGYETLGA